MKRDKSKSNSWKYGLLTLVLVFPGQINVALSFERIVVLYAPASDIVRLLTDESRVVGVTRTDHNFKKAVKVGSHLRPNIELIKALEPDLMIMGSERAFPTSMQERFTSQFHRYDPLNLDELLRAIERLGDLLDAREVADGIVRQQIKKLQAIQKPATAPTTIYEISERSLRVAGGPSIMTSIIEAAGGVNLIQTRKKHVVISAEMVIDLNPDYYIYQKGPMNKNPEKPSERAYFKPLQSRVILVDQYLFSRPGINAFDAVIKLNQIFLKGNQG